MESVAAEWSGSEGVARVGALERLGRVQETHAGVEVVFEWQGDIAPVRWWFRTPYGSLVEGEIA